MCHLWDYECPNVSGHPGEDVTTVYSRGFSKWPLLYGSRHVSRAACTFLEESGITLWKTPPKSSDANPIENVWHELKEYIRREVKPTTKEQLVKRITDYWNIWILINALNISNI